MACPQCPAPGSYTSVIIPLRSSLYSLDALRFYLWIKRLKDLEREKDSLWAGLQVLEQARLWYRRILEDNRARQANVCTRAGARANEWGGEVWGGAGASSCLLRSQIQRVNGSLGSLMSMPNVISCPSSPKRNGVEVSDSELRWQNTVLVQEVSEKNAKISLLEQERDSLLQELSLRLGVEV
ncbi:suppressor APC domain-containing protein 1 isoform X2 [Oncorhynchus tshawytscha]|uniref:suppressor APC domain-containing protein 1 isoform X2 n=1 Tax=Oncorhynchus tshawytscha TaxID=74940 RepID=UPI000D09D06C|nr:suppressor APC domain-containing protein 1 isoform X2 [Oncorhynchus tshawytscha]